MKTQLLALSVFLALQPLSSAAQVNADNASSAEAGGQAIEVLLKSTHRRLVFDRDVVRVAVGDPETLSAEVLNSGEILVLGKEIGSASLVVWFEDGTAETRLLAVQRDHSTLEDALFEVHSSIRVEVASDRDTVVLRGLVPDVSYRNAADSVASAYLESRKSGARELPLIRASGAGDGDSDAFRSAEGGPGGAVINLIQLETLPPLAEEKLASALEPVAGAKVTVRRVLFGDLPDDEQDLFILEGVVQDQVTLSRVLYLASRALVGDSSAQGNDIKVLADESGALTTATQIFGSGAVGGAAGQANFSLGSSGGVGGSAQQSGSLLANRIGANLGRAKVVEAAGGRILSLINVEHLPLVRVDVRLYEVNLTRLRDWRNEFSTFESYVLEDGTISSAPVSALQGSAPVGNGQTSFQNVFRFLDGGISNQVQLVSSGFGVDDAFQLLVSQEIARSVSRPSLTVLSGELALFQVGGQIPVSVAQTIGGGTDQVLNSVVFRDFGVQLSIRPLVEEHGSETITLDLTPRVSLPDLELTAAVGAATGAEVGSTAFETRGARTHTRLRDGDSMLLGGLISQRESRAVGKTPGLGDISLLGWLFRNVAENEEEFELVVVVNPVIVRPERADARLWSFISTGQVLESCMDEVRGASSKSEAKESDPAEEKEAESGTLDS